MSPINDRQLARKLRAGKTPEPPPGLLEELRRQIPAQIEAPPPPQTGGLLPFRRPLSRRVWLAAASVAMLVGGGTLSWVALRYRAGLEEVEPREHFHRSAEYYQTPADASGGSAEATQPRDRRAWGDAGPGARAAVPAPVPASPGRFGEAREEQASTSLRRRLTPPAVQPMEAPERLAGRPESAGEAGRPDVEAQLDAAARGVISTTAEARSLDDRKLSAAATPPPAEREPSSTSLGPLGSVQSPTGATGVRAEVGGNEAKPKADRDRRQAPAVEQAMAQGAPAATGPKLGTRSPEPLAPPSPATAPPPPARTAPERAGGSEEAYGGVLSQSRGVIDFVDSEDDRLSTFALDVDTGSYDLVRRYLAHGGLPPSSVVRVEELVNAFDYGDPPPAEGDFALGAEASTDPWAPGDRYVLVRFAVTAREARGGEAEAVATSARAEVEVDPRYVASWRLLGDGAATSGPRHRNEGGGAVILAGHAISALYELELRPEVPPSATLVALRLRWVPGGGEPVQEQQRLLRESEVASRWEGASRAFRLATLAGHFAEVLRGSHGAASSDLDELARKAAAVRADWPRQQRVSELEELIAQVRDLSQRGGGARPRKPLPERDR